MLYKGWGKLRYAPLLYKNNNKEIQYNKTEQWLVVDCDTEIGKYYRSLYYNSKYNAKTKKINNSIWKEHITIIRGEEIPEEKKIYWNKYNNKEIEFEYSNKIYTNGMFYWLQIYSHLLLDLREELGLSRELTVPLHLTLGNNKNTIESQFTNNSWELE